MMFGVACLIIQIRNALRSGISWTHYSSLLNASNEDASFILPANALRMRNNVRRLPEIFLANRRKYLEPIVGNALKG